MLVSTCPYGATTLKTDIEIQGDSQLQYNNKKDIWESIAAENISNFFKDSTSTKFLR
jgi:hypothetical protein